VPLKRAPAGSGRAPVASRTGAEAWAGVDYVGAAPVASGWTRWGPGAGAGGGGWGGGGGGRRQRVGRHERHLAATAAARCQRRGLVNMRD
jgi:hypothetical protein